MTTDEKTVILTGTSFLQFMRTPKCIQALADLVISETPKGINVRKPYSTILLDVFEKFGSMLYESDKIRVTEKRHREGAGIEHGQVLFLVEIGEACQSAEKAY